MITFSYQLPANITAGTVTQLASARPFNAVTGIDNNGDGATTIARGRRQGDREVGVRHGTQDVSVFFEAASITDGAAVADRGFNLFNHGNIMGRARTPMATPRPDNTFGQVAAVGTATNAIPALANIDPPRMVQFQIRYLFWGA